MVLGSSLGMVLGIDVGASVGPVVLVGKVGLLPAPGPHAAAIESVRTAPRINRILFKAQSSLVRKEEASESGRAVTGRPAPRKRGWIPLVIGPIFRGARLQAVAPPRSRLFRCRYTA